MTGIDGRKWDRGPFVLEVSNGRSKILTFFGVLGVSLMTRIPFSEFFKRKAHADAAKCVQCTEKGVATEKAAELCILCSALSSYAVPRDAILIFMDRCARAGRAKNLTQK